jgi:hypothetical protein
VKCKPCNGTGRVPDRRAIGKKFNAMRRDARLTLRAVAVKMGISISYLSDMEQGRKNWSRERVRQFEDVVRPKNGAKK